MIDDNGHVCVRGGGIGPPPPSGERAPRLMEAILCLEPGYTK